MWGVIGTGRCGLLEGCVGTGRCGACLDWVSVCYCGAICCVFSMITGGWDLSVEHVSKKPGTVLMWIQFPGVA